MRHQQPLHLHAAGGALLQHLLEQNALVRHVLVDDPQPVAARGDDEALVDLAQRAQVGQRRERHLGRRDGLRRKFAVRVQVPRSVCPEGGGPGVTSIGGALKSKRGAGARGRAAA